MRKNLITFVLSLALVGSVAAQQAPATSSRVRFLGPPIKVGEFKERRDDFKKEFEVKKEELKKKVETDREELKARLKNIKDQAKKNAVERIDASLKALNSRLLEQYSNMLDKLEAILKRIAGRTDTVAGRGIDVSAVRSAIAAAEKAISDARAAILAQSGKVYAITVSGENKVKEDVGKTRQALHADLVKVREAVKTAREAVHRAAELLGKIRGGEERSTSTPATSTATSTQ